MRSVLAGIVGDAWVEEAAYPFDELEGLRPRLVVSPGSAEETAEVLRAAAREGWAVLPVGKGHLRGLGNPPSAGDFWLSTRRLTAITEYEPADLTAAVQSGCTLGDFNARLAQCNQILPWDPPGGAERTMGGVASVGRIGPLRLGFGQPRDWIIGMQAATLEGKLIRAGGRVVKNVAGYDLTKLFVGSLGTLGVITELNVRVRPQPATELSAVVSSPDSSALWSLARKTMASYVQPVALEIVSAEAMRWAGLNVLGRNDYLCARLAGEDADVREQVLRLESLASELSLDMSEQVGQEHVLPFWRGVADLPLHEAAQIALRLSVPPSRLEDTARTALSALSTHMEQIAHTASPGFGVLWVLLGGVVNEDRLDEMVPKIERLREVCRANDGSLVLERAPVELKKQLDAWGPVGTAEGLMRGMKRLFDPDGRLNPGRFVAGL